MNYSGLFLLFIGVALLAIFVGLMWGDDMEACSHRDVCPCKDCTAWRIERDAKKQANELRRSA